MTQYVRFKDQVYMEIWRY